MSYVNLYIYIISYIHISIEGLNTTIVRILQSDAELKQQIDELFNKLEDIQDT